jgi:hypothetical protein
LNLLLVALELLDISHFTYLHSDAAVVMLSGQLADGFATIFVGELVWPKLGRIICCQILI